MSSSGRPGSPASEHGRSAPGSRPRNRLRGASRGSAGLRWAVLLVLVLSIVAASVWAFTRTSGSGADSGDPSSGSAPGVPPGTVVSLTFDGGKASQYRNARPLLRQYGMHATFYVPTGPIDANGPCCMSWQQVEQLYREGDEIGGTSRDALDLTVPSPDPARDYVDKQQQVCGARDRLAGLGLDPRSFAYPAGKHAYEFPARDGSLADLVASCGYSSGRVIGGLFADRGPAASSIPLPPEEPYVVRTPDRPSPAPITLEELQRAVTAGAGDRRWIPLVFNEVCHSADPSYGSCMSTVKPVDGAVLSAFLRWLHDAGAPDGAPAGTTVRTVREVMGAPPPPPLPGPSTVVSLTFDGGHASQELAGDVLRAHRMHGTFFVNTGLIEGDNPYAGSNPNHLSWEQIFRLLMQGNEVGGQTSSYVDLTDPGIPESVKRDEICGDRTRLWQMGLDPQSFAYPYGKVDEAARQLVQSCGYRSARSIWGASPEGAVVPDTIPPVDPFSTRAVRVSGSSPLSFDSLQRALVTVADSGGGWVQVVFHRICRSSDPGFAACMADGVDESALTAFLDWLQNDAPPGTTVRTVREVVADGP
jgi:peptidoglycan/xylan/chitin deacetylase (PgdA/CDA1 family)